MNDIGDITSGRVVMVISVLFLILIVLVGPVAGISISDHNRAMDSDQKAAIQDGNEMGKVITVGENRTYERLQVAIDNAQKGDTIQVASGTYNPVWIHKQIKLIGVNTGGGKPVIDVGDTEQAIRIMEAENVRVEGFHFKGNDNQGIHFTDSLNSAIIVNNTFDVEIGFVMVSESDPHIIYANDFSNTNKVMAIYGEGEVENHWNSTNEITYWWNGEKRTGHLGNYYGESGVDSTGNGIADEVYKLNRYPWSNTDYHPLVGEPWKYFKEGVGSSNTDTQTLTSVEEDQPLTSSEDEEQSVTEDPATTRAEDATQDLTSVNEEEVSDDEIQDERQRGFFSNSSNGPEFLSNALNLTVLGFVLSVAGILQQLMGGR